MHLLNFKKCSHKLKFPPQHFAELLYRIYACGNKSVTMSDKNHRVGEHTWTPIDLIRFVVIRNNRNKLVAD